MPHTPASIWSDPFINGQAGTNGNAQAIDQYIDSFESDILNFEHSIELFWDQSPLFEGGQLKTPHVQYGLVDPTASLNNYYIPSEMTFIRPVAGTGFISHRGTFSGSGFVNDKVARQTFSLATCNGCHHGEAFEDSDAFVHFGDVHPGQSTPGGILEEPFRHVRPTTLGSPAELSRFITGTQTSCSAGDEFVFPLGTLMSCSSPSCCPIGDPALGYQDMQSHYNEFARRGQILDSFVTQSCTAIQVNPGNEVILSAH